MPLDGLIEINADDVTRLRHRAADLIQHLGHCKSKFIGVNGETCLANALYAAETGFDFDGWCMFPTPLMSAALYALGLGDLDGACALNNRLETTGETLVELLRGESHHAA